MSRYRLQPFANGGEATMPGLGAQTHMSLFPLFPIAASPSLPLALQRIARTPTARLAINYELVPRLGRVDRQPVAQSPAVELRHFAAAGMLSRPLGAALAVDRLVTGGITGTILPILDRPPQMWLAPLGPVGHPTVGKNLDITA